MAERLNLVVNVNVNFGTMESEQDYRIENGRYVCYGRSIYRNLDGLITKTTLWEVISSMGWDDGAPITKQDIARLKGNS